MGESWATNGTDFPVGPPGEQEHPMSDLFRALDGVTRALDALHQTLPPLLTEVDRLRAQAAEVARSEGSDA